MVCLVFFGMWVIAMLVVWPFEGMSMPMLIFLGAKLTLGTAVFLTLVISLMRFAIRCARHEEKEKDDLPNPTNSWEEVVKAFLKNIKLSSGS